MSEKLIHIDGALGETFKDWCRKNGTTMKHKVERMIRQRIGVVTQKDADARPIDTSAPSDEVWTRPPFWAK